MLIIPFYSKTNESTPFGCLTQLVKHLIAYFMKTGNFTFSASVKVFPSIICFGSSNRFTNVFIIELSSALSKFKSFISNGSNIDKRIASLEIVSSSLLSKLA